MSIWNANCGQATAQIFDWRMDVILFCDRECLNPVEGNLNPQR